VLRDPVPGATLTLTLDPQLQFRAERELEAAARASGAEAGSVVVLDPYTGDVLAMASYPTFNPNLPPAQGEDAMRARQNLAVSRTFEPGSVFKVITVAAAMEKTNLTPESMVDCGNGLLNLYGRVIHDHDPYRSLSVADVLAHSSNIGAIRIALATGNQNFYEYEKRFGFGSKTGCLYRVSRRASCGRWRSGPRVRLDPWRWATKSGSPQCNWLARARSSPMAECW
jgi:cell division protein FtsI (penicillin-binding protein 3)